MTCSSNTIFTPEAIRAALRNCSASVGAALIAAALVFAAPGRAGPAATAEELVLKADAALARGDGIAAEMHLKQALARGASRGDVAAMIGEAYLDQGKLDQARGWLATGNFSARTAVRGLRMLAHLERLSGNVGAAGAALDEARALSPGDAGLWVETASQRYASGEQIAAIAAADHALSLDPRDTGALVFKGMLVRDRYGLAAAIPWFEAALAHSPGNTQALGEYAATLGELGRAREMLTVTRRMIEIDGGSSRAFYLQAVLAARAGKTDLARRLLARGGKGLTDLPGAMLLSGLLDMEAGNLASATDTFERLAARQPANARVRHLLARALFLSGAYRQVVERFSAAAGRSDAAPYLLIVVARALENLGQRELAAPLLDRAARDYTRPIAPVTGSDLGEAIASGEIVAARAQTSRWAAQAPGNAAYRTMAGDVELAAGNPLAAIEHWRAAGQVRMTGSLMIRLSAALEATGQGAQAAEMVEARLVLDPTNPAVIRLAAAVARRQGDWRRTVLLLENLRAGGGGRDVHLLIDIADARLRAGDRDGAMSVAREAWLLQRSSGYVAQVYGSALARAGPDPAAARALLDKAARMGADYRAIPAVRYPFAAGG